MRARRVLPTLALAAIMVVAGCSSSGGSSSDSSSSGATTAVHRGGTITVGTAQGIPQLNPAVRTFAWEEVLFPLLWDGLTKSDQDGKIVPDVAESWTASADQQTWTFKLRSGVTFSDGTALTAADVVKTFDYYRNPDTATQEANKIATIDTVTATDPATVTVKLKAPNALFPSAIVWVKILKVDALASIDKNPIGTGPYKVSQFVPNDHLDLVRNDKYFGTAAALDGINIVTAADAAAASNSLASGDLDVLWSLPQSNANQYQGNSGVNLLKPAVPSQWPSWEVDTTTAPFNNVKARQALAYAVDRTQVLQAAYYGQGLLSPTNDPLGTNNPSFSADGLTDYSYDLDKAKALFAEAGVNAGATLTWWGIAGQNPEWNTSGQILQASLKKIGITLKIENNDISTWVGKFYPAGKSYPGLIVPNFQSTPVEPAYSINFLLKGRCECNWDDPAFTAAYNKAVAEPDENARKADWADVQKIINEQVPVIVPLQSNVLTAVSKKIQGVWMEGGGQLHLENASIAGS
jgi:peptide/nickel transport system substrate-binding protein